MQKQELLELINKTWPLGVNTNYDVPKLRFQRDDKLIEGYSLNICQGLEIDCANVLFDEFLYRRYLQFVNKISTKTIYDVIYSIIYLYLILSLLETSKELGKDKNRIIMVGRRKEGQSIVFGSDESLYKDLSYFDIFYGNFEKDFEMPHKSFPMFPSKHERSYVLGFLEELPVIIPDKSILKIVLNQLFPDIYNSDIESHSKLIYIDSYTPNNENFDFTLDYLLYDNKVVFLNDFDLNKFYEKKLELINRLCQYSSKFDKYKNKTEIFKAKYEHCYNKVLALLKEKEVISDFDLDKILDLSEVTSLIEKYKYWIVKEFCSNCSKNESEIIPDISFPSGCEKNNEKKPIEIFPKGLVLSTEQINKKRFLESLSQDGNIELNIYGINKLRKVLYKNIEPINSDIDEKDIDKNKLLWSDRDRIFYKDTGKFEFFVNENDEIIPKKYYQDLFSKLLDSFTEQYLNKNYSLMREIVKDYQKDFEFTLARIDDDNYTKIVQNISLDLEIEELVDAVGCFIQYWDIKFNINEYLSGRIIPDSNFKNSTNFDKKKSRIDSDALTENIIKTLSFSKIIEEKDKEKLEKLFKILYLNSLINKKDSLKASKIRNFKNTFINEKDLDSYELRRIIYEFRNLINLPNYESKINQNLLDIIKSLSSYTLYSIFKIDKNRMILKIDKDNLYFKIRSILFKFFENIKQYPNFNYNIDSLPDLNKCSDFSMLNDSLEKVSKFLPETIKNQWKNTIGKISIIGKINFEDFNVKTATFLINIYYDLDNSKEYTKDELEPIWERCNFQLEDYTNEEYSFEVTLDNLLKSGFLKTNDENYTVNV